MLANFSNLITFSRGSNATVTDASGRLTYAPHNLVTNSQDFEASAWTKTAASITANSAVAPDGTTTADTITEDTTAASAHRIFQTPANPIGPVIASVYVKAGTRSWFYIRLTDSASVVRYAYFNVSTGVLGTVDAGITASITPAGNGWYRCSAFINAVNSTVCVFAITDANGNPVHNGNGTGTLSLWGAQLEAVTYQTTPSPYVSTSVANLLGFSEDFTNAAWTKSNSSIVPNAAQNPINNLWNAQKLMENTAAGVYHFTRQQFTVGGTAQTFSIYVKAAERTRAVVGITDLTTGDASVGVDLTNGTTFSSGLAVGSWTNISSSVVSVGNGWYRVSITATRGAGTQSAPVVAPVIAAGSTTYTGDGNSGIYIYGAQLSNSGSLDPYVPTPGAAPSSTAYYGPRFDYDPVTLAAKGILIEEQRTNLLLRSSDPSALPWGFDASTGSSITLTGGLSPDGVTQFAVFNEGTSTGAHRANQGITVTAGTTYTVSAYVKAGTSRYIIVGTNSGGIAIDTTTWTITETIAGANTTTTNGTLTPIGGGVYRASVSVAHTTNTTVFFVVGTSVSATPGTVNPSFTGTSRTAIFNLCNFEAGAFATSYIPTIASTVTRAADAAQITGSLFSQWYRQDEGSFVIRSARLSTAALDGISASAFTDGNNNIEMFARTADSRLLVFNGGATQVNLIDTSKISAGVSYTAAAGYSLNNYALVTNNGTVLTDTTATVPTAVSLGVGSRSGNLFYNGHIQSIQYIPNRVSDTQLQSLSAS